MLWFLVALSLAGVALNNKRVCVQLLLVTRYTEVSGCRASSIIQTPHGKEVNDANELPTSLHPTAISLVAPEPAQAHRRLWYQPARTSFNWFVPRVNNTAPDYHTCKASHTSTMPF